MVGSSARLICPFRQLHAYIHTSTYPLPSRLLTHQLVCVCIGRVGVSVRDCLSVSVSVSCRVCAYLCQLLQQITSVYLSVRLSDCLVVCLV